MINPLRDPAETCIIEFWWLGIATTLFDKDNEEFIKSKIAINIKIRSDSRTLSKKTPGTMISVEKTRKYLKIYLTSTTKEGIIGTCIKGD